MSHQKKYWLYAIIAFGGSAIAGIITGNLVPRTMPSGNPQIMIPLLMGVVGVVMYLTWLWWQKTDDVQQQGQLISWYWGGTFGAVVTLVCLIVLTGRHSDLSLGATYLFMAQGAGFFVAWLIWRLRGRGQAE